MTGPDKKTILFAKIQKKKKKKPNSEKDTLSMKRISSPYKENTSSGMNVLVHIESPNSRKSCMH